MCLQISPCNGWMNPDPALRDFTSERAFNLSVVARNIVETEKYQNFEMLYTDYDIEKAIEIHEARGGEGWELIGRFFKI